MSDPLELVYQSVDEQHADKSAATRRQLVAGAAATLGGMGLLAVPGVVQASHRPGEPRILDHVSPQDPQTILNIAATAEVLATIVNTVGFERVRLPKGGREKIAASAREELIHYKVLVDPGFGNATPATKRIWVPDSVFANADNFLATLEVGDQIFVNAYLIAVTIFGSLGSGNLARAAAEFMGAEAVHRAFARDLRGELGNDRAFMKFEGREHAPGAPNRGQEGFTHIEEAVTQLQAAGFGFGAPGASPGRFYDFDAVRRRTPNPEGVNTRLPD